jgi:biotin carboxyl carrier protein
LSKSIDDGIKKRKVDIRKKREGYVVTIDGFPYLIEQGQILADGRIEFVIAGTTFRAVVAQEGKNSYIIFNGQTYKLKEIEDEFARENVFSDDSLKSPMPGRITKILVKVGEVVKPKQQLLILEAMKMENVITSPFAGTVSKIYYKENDQVKEGEALLKIDPMDKIEKNK